MTLHDTLIHAVTEYDRKQSTRADFNKYALPQYFEAIERVEASLQFEGVTLRRALMENFCGRLLTVLLKATKA